MARITSVETLPLDLEFKEPLQASEWTYTTIRNAFVRLRLDDGTIGYGEAAPLPHFSGETQSGVLSAIAEYLAPTLIGLDAFDAITIEDRMRGAIGEAHTAKAGVDMALYDARGKLLGLPVHQLLGGQAQREFTTCRAIGYDSPEVMVERTKGFAAEGFSTFEVKMISDTNECLPRILALLETAPAGTVFFFDPNESWSLADALALARELRQIDGQYFFEQPIKKENLEGLAELRRTTGVRISADESVQGPESVLEIVRAHAADILNIKLTKVGGFRAAQACMTIAEAAGVRYRVDTMVESKIGNTAHAHLAAASRQTLCAVDPHLNVRNDPVLAGGLSVERGRVVLPGSPGLGITLKPEFA